MALAEKPRARSKVWAEEIAAARRRAGLVLPAGFEDRIGPLRSLLAQWALAEVAPGGLCPWLAFGFGIVGYFTADREPAWWAALSAAVVAIAYAARLRPVGFPLAFGVAAAAAGFATATLQTIRIAHPVLQTSVSTVTCPALSKSARSASAATVSSFTSITWKASGLAKRPTACASRCERAPRRWSAASSR